MWTRNSVIFSRCWRMAKDQPRVLFEIPSPHRMGSGIKGEGFCNLSQPFPKNGVGTGDGVNLRQLLARGRLAAREALAIVPQICDALQFAHDQGIIHRDIKPENILLDRRGRVKVADFGLAKLAGMGNEPAGGASSVVDSIALTENGRVMGTPNYMSPEQFERPTEVDHRADIYALGVVFYQMLTGELPGRQLQPPSRKVRLDVRLDEIVLQALKQKPERHYQHASVMKSDLTAVSTSAAPGPERLDPAGAPTFSGAAILGACLAPFFFLSMMYWDFGSSGGFQALLGLTASLLGLIAILGTTLAGWVAVRQIRRSEGRLCGMWLAVTDGLFLPVVLFDLLLFFVLLTGTKLFNHFILARWYPEMEDHMALNWAHAALVLFIYASVMALSDYGIVRLVWRAVSKPAKRAVAVAPEGRPAPPPASRHAGQITAGVAALLLIYLFTFLVIRHYHNRSDYIGQVFFFRGDSIEISSVQRSKERLTVMGRYHLVSADQADLALYITSTTPNPGGEPPFDARQQQHITKGSGQFVLIDSHPTPGLPHVSLYASDGQPFAHYYFGAKEESLRERRMDLGNQ
jgi:serine/threonine protein kinase